MSGPTGRTLLNDAKQSVRRHPVVTGVAGITAVLILAVSLRLLVPVALWAYNVERAGRLMDTGLSWPAPRQVDSLPEVRDNSALDNALGHLSAAIRWRPDHFHAYRLAGRVYTARGDWSRAADALEQAYERAPENPMPAWEAGLVYEQMVHAIEEAPTTSLVDALAAGTIEAPAAPIETPFCVDGPETCYVGQTTFAQPYAGVANEDAPVTEAPTVFMHPPARVRLTREIPAEQPALRFLVGLDPAARAWGTDGATFQIWVEPRGEQSELVYQRTVDGDTAVQGWVAGWADLSTWGGEEVTLVFGVGPNGDGAGDWFGWGDVALTTVDAARYWAQVPAARMREMWTAAGFNSEEFSERGEQAYEEQNYSEALAWYNRTGFMSPLNTKPWFQIGRVHEALERWEQARLNYEKAAGDGRASRDLWYHLGIVYSEQQLWDRAVEAFHEGITAQANGQVGVSNLYYRIGRILHSSATPSDLEGAWTAYERAVDADDFVTDRWQRVDVRFRRGQLLARQDRWEEAISEYRKVLRLQPKHYYTLIFLTEALWQTGRKIEAKEVALQATEIQPSNELAYHILGNLYKSDNNIEMARSMYTKALKINPNNNQIRTELQRLGADDSQQ